VVDGGKGQLGVATTVAADLGVEGIDIVGLAKSRVLDGRARRGRRHGAVVRASVPAGAASDPIPLLSHTDELHLMTYVRDEAHRFAITFHRKVRDTSTLRTVIDDVPGIGPARRRALLRQFGSVERLAAATTRRSPRCRASGPQKAAALRAFLGSDEAAGYDEPDAVGTKDATET
jgi:excinuclease ABC subunit C